MWNYCDTERYLGVITNFATFQYSLELNEEAFELVYLIITVLSYHITNFSHLRPQCRDSSSGPRW